MSTLPTGTVTFLFTDIEGSTKIAQEHPEARDAMKKRHDVIMQNAIGEHLSLVFQEDDSLTNFERPDYETYISAAR
jgi:hypothetical protein